MATPQLSPGVLTREVDLTVGRADNVLDNIGAIAGPFAIGPVEQAIDITTEQELINTFGRPISTDAQYEYWMTASSFLSYGGVLKIARVDGSSLNNANAAVGYAATTSAKIKNYDNYNNTWSGEGVEFVYAAKNPGSWANNLKVCFIDDFADQTIGVTTTNLSNLGAQVGYGITTAITSTAIAGVGTTTSFTGYLKGIITGVSTDTTNGSSTIDVKIVSRVSSAGTETSITYSEGNSVASFEQADTLYFVNNSGINTGLSASAGAAAGQVLDWYDQQTLGLTNSVIFWKSIAPKPRTNAYSAVRNGKNDAMHIAIVDDTGSVTGIQGNLLEKHVSVSKALDSISQVNSPQKIWYKNYLADFSQYLYAGYNPSQAEDAYHGTVPVATGFSTSFTKYTTGQGLWGQNAQGITFNALGNVTYTLSSGVDYSAAGGMQADLGSISTAYDLFANKDEIQVDYLLNGPGLLQESESQAKANKLIAVAESRKDCVAVISPHRAGVVDLTNTDTQTDNVIRFFSPITSSSYAIFDSGYKYTYDRFNNTFRYIPCNGDIAGLMTRTNITGFPWFSPAGQQRGVLNNAIKLAYNPSKAQRDVLYTARVNAIVNQPGTGVLLFGDKTALSYPSAFDRINVRRLFLTVEQALERSAQAQLFELNDQTTRSNFVNIVEPYLRDVQAKRGIYDFIVICDESNNTPDVIDNNEFRADIFLKPTKSINYITLTFVATRTGVSFEEVAGSV
jgi:phage tail sheath protein FI